MDYKRTLTQNRGLYKYFELIAHELQNQGHTMNDVVEKYSAIEIYPTTHSVKEVLWKPIMTALLGKSSTTELTTKEINQVYDAVSMFLAKQFGISLPFPSQENTEEYIKSLE